MFCCTFTTFDTTTGIDGIEVSNTTTARSIEYLSRSRRRLVVAVAIAGYPVAVAVLAGLKHAGLNRWLVLALFMLALLPTVAALLVSYRYARGRIDGRRARLDERDLALRQQAYALSHHVLATILTVAAAVTVIYLTGGNVLRLDANNVVPATMWVIVFIPALPSVMLTWIETDQPADA
jgi:hypothetical protein